MGDREVRVVWVFNGKRNQFPSAVFSERSKAEQWIQQHKLEGCLTAYPVDISVHDWAVQFGLFVPKKAEHSSSDFIANFSSAKQEHYHYERDGSVV